MATSPEAGAIPSGKRSRLQELVEAVKAVIQSANPDAAAVKNIPAKK